MSEKGGGVLETSSPLTSAIVSDVFRMWFRCGSLSPVLLFLGFLDFLGKFEARNLLGYLGVFSVFSKDFVGSAGKEHPW